MYVRILLVFAVASTALCSSYYTYLPATIHENAGRYLKAAWKSCPTNITNEDEYENEYQTVLENFYNCSSDLTDTNVSLCYGFQQHLRKCAQPLVDYLVGCLPEKSVKLPQVYLDSIEKVIEVYCRSSGELVTEIMHECIFNVFYINDESAREECKVQSFRDTIEEIEGEILSTKDFCRLSGTIKTCWSEFVDRNCKSSKTKEIFSSLSNALSYGCRKYS